MDLYKVDKLIKITGGLVGLTSNQASKRKESLKVVRDGVYEVVGKVYFKAGEKVKLQNVSRSLSVNLTNIGTNKKVTQEIAERKTQKRKPGRPKRK